MKDGVNTRSMVVLFVVGFLCIRKSKEDVSSCKFRGVGRGGLILRNKLLEKERASLSLLFVRLFLFLIFSAFQKSLKTFRKLRWESVLCNLLFSLSIPLCNCKLEENEG